MTEFKVTNSQLHALAHRFQTDRLLAAINELPVELIESQGASKRVSLGSVGASDDTRLSTLGFLLRRTDSGECFLCVDLASLSTFNAPLEGVDIPIEMQSSLSPLIARIKRKEKSDAPLSEIVTRSESLLWLPVRTLYEVKINVKFADDLVSKDVTLLTAKISAMEKRLIDLQRRRDAAIANYETAAIEFAEVAEQKKMTTSHLRGLVTRSSVDLDSPPPPKLPAPPSRQSSRQGFFKFPSLPIGDISPRLSEYVPNVIKSMASIEKTYFEKRNKMDIAKDHLTTVDSELHELNDVKTLYILQVVDFARAMDQRRHDIVWRSLTGAAEAFGLENRRLSRQSSLQTKN
jgi:hypothetical protein